MLNISDLAKTDTLESKDMRGIAGGMSRPTPAFSFFEKTDYDYKEVVNMQHAVTMQDNKLLQSADVVSVVGGKGNFVGITGGSNGGSQFNDAFNA